MANQMYPLARQKFADGLLAWTTADWRVSLQLNTHVYDDTDEFFSDVSADSVDVSPNLASKTNVFGVCDAADVTLPTVTAASTVGSLIVYQWTGSAATSPVVIFYDSKASAEMINFLTDGGDVLIRWSNGPTKMFRL